MKIRTKLDIIPIALAIILIVSLFIILITSNGTIKNQIGNYLLTTTQSKAHHVKSVLHNYKETAGMFAVGIPFVNVLDPQIDYTKRMTECNLRIKQSIETNTDISRIRILNKKGIVIASNHEDIGFDKSDKTIFIKGKNSVYISGIHKSEYTGTLVLSVSVPIYVRDIFSGVLIVNFDVEKQLYKILTNRAGLGETGETYIVNSDAYMISPSRFIDDVILKIKLNSDQVNLYLSEHQKKGLTENMEEKPTEYLNYIGKEVLGTHYYIPEMQWGLIAEINVEEVYKPINKQTVFMITILLVFLTVIFLIVVMITKSISRPIKTLTKGAEEIIKGNIDYKIDVESKDEIGLLSRTFDIMTGRLNKSQKELRKYTGDLETKVKERTSDLEKQFEKSERQRIAGLVILNDLNKTTKKLKSEIDERKRTEKIQKVLYNISNAVSITDNLKKLIGLIQKELGTIIDTTNFFVALHDHKTDTISLPFYTDKKDKYTSIPAGKTLTKYVIETKKPLLANIDFKKKLVKEGKLEHIGSLSKIWLGVPLKIEGKIIGVLAVQSYTDEFAYNESDMKMLEFISGQVSLSVERKQAEEKIKKYRDHLEEVVTERTEQLRHANAELAKAAGMKDEFLANMSHELRTPLNAVLGLSEALQEEIYGKLNQKQTEKIQHIEESGRHLLSLINEILDLAKIEAGKIVLEYSRISIEELIQSSLKFIKQTAFKKKIKVSTSISGTIETFRADEKRMKQILVNLLSNAVKFTSDEGQIGLEVDVSEENQTISFIVWDTGIGISQKNIDKLFQPFVQIDSTLSRQYEGTGLGLALVDKLINMHNGSITVGSEEGEGSRFIVTIPIMEYGEGGESELKDPKIDKLNSESDILTVKEDVREAKEGKKLILLAEDNEFNITTIKDYLEAKQFKVLVARNGKEAVEMANEVNPNLILMDIQMPVMNGLEATKEIRASSNSEISGIPIIALTSLAMPGDRERCLNAGVDDYMKKPVGLKNLVKTINEFLEKKA